MASLVYNKGAAEILNGGTDFLTGDIRVLLTTTAEVPDQDDNFVSDIVANEIAVAGYARVVAGTKTVTEDDATNRVNLGCANPTWAALAVGATIRYAHFYRHTGVDATSPLLCACQLTSDHVTDGGALTLTVPVGGFAFSQQ